MRSRVSMVMRLPSRSRCTSLPSLTARRPKVDSAISAWRQYSEIWLRIWSFFIGRKNLGQPGGQRRIARLSYHHLPTLGNAGSELSALSRPACAERLGKRDRLEPQAQPRQQTNASQFGAWGFDAPLDFDGHVDRGIAVRVACVTPGAGPVPRATRA